ncbi:MAG: TetR/AcrR family transcriptional regulator [Boseongicola sp.]|nr:TetR/AcrR family transcriptional regulator [Boseongicola sp.]MDD9976671.1 TetR/AcrR family transcriptional regulator [Boseongicola sp.]
MNTHEDPRLIATRTQAIEAALKLLREKGVLAVTHASVSAKTGISRSTLYRHWPTLNDLRNNAFRQAATSPDFAARTNGPLKTDLAWILGVLLTALNDTAWGQVAPQVIAAAATDDQAKSVINSFMADRFENVREIFNAAKERGELPTDLDVQPLIEMAVAVPYFRKLVAGLPLDADWLETHVDLICELATSASTTMRR